MAARTPEVLQRDVRNGPLEPLLLASSQLEGLRQRGPLSLLLVKRVRRWGLKQT